MKNLKIYLDNIDRFNSMPLWKYLLQNATKLNLKGATVYKAVAGIGKHKELHTFELVSLSNTMPLIIEIIEKEENIKKFLELSKDSKELLCNS